MAAAGNRRHGSPQPRGERRTGERDHDRDHERDRRPGRARGHGHSHDHGPATPASTRLRVVIAALLVPFAVAAGVGLAMLWPKHSVTTPVTAGPGTVWVQGTVTGAQTVPCAALGAGGTGGGSATSGAGGSATGGAGGATGGGATGTATDKLCTQLAIRLTSGPTKGSTTTLTVGQDPATPRYSPGDSLDMEYTTSAATGAIYSIKDIERGPPLASIAIAFAIFVVAIGRWRGFAALAALAVSFVLLIKFMLPAILGGRNAVEVAAVAAAVILFVALYSTHGLSVRTSVAVLGTGASLALIAVLASLSIHLARITGLGTDEGAQVAGLFSQVDVRGLLLAGVIVGALGVLDDVTVTQVSSVWELRQADPALTAGELYRAGMRIGRDHIGSAINTLFLAYAGAALPLLILASTSGRGWSTAASSEVVAEEIVRTLIGSIGLVAAVPITTALAAAIAASEPRPDTGDEDRPSAVREREPRPSRPGVARPGESTRRGPVPRPTRPAAGGIGGGSSVGSSSGSSTTSSNYGDYSAFGGYDDYRPDPPRVS